MQSVEVVIGVEDVGKRFQGWVSIAPHNTHLILSQIVEMDEEVQIPVERADKRYFALGRRNTGGRASTGARGPEHALVPHAAAHEPRGLISDVIMQDAALHIYLRSVLQVPIFRRDNHYIV